MCAVGSASPPVLEVQQFLSPLPTLRRRGAEEFNAARPGTLSAFRRMNSRTKPRNRKASLPQQRPQMECK
jgi:hypothetical protein